MAVEQLARADDREHGVDRALVLVDHERVHALALGALGHELEVQAADPQARLREAHLDVLDERPEERPVAVHARAACAALPALSASGPSAVPTPYQAGSSVRFCVHEKTHGIARSPESSPPPAGPAGGPRADLEQRELVDRREAVEELGERLVRRRTRE